MKISEQIRRAGIRAAEVSEKDMKELRKLIDRNLHWEALQYVAEKIAKNRKMAKAFGLAADLHETLGFLPPGLGEMRTFLAKDLQRKMGPAAKPLVGVVF